MNEIQSPEAVWISAKEYYIDRLFGMHCTRMGKQFWINKTPGFLNYLDGLSTLYPNAKFLVMLRDGRDIAVSNLLFSWGPATVEAAARIKTKKLECGIGLREGLPVGCVTIVSIAGAKESFSGRHNSYSVQI